MLDNINADDFLRDLDDDGDKAMGNSYDPFTYDDGSDKVTYYL